MVGKRRNDRLTRELTALRRVSIHIAPYIAGEEGEALRKALEERDKALQATIIGAFEQEAEPC